ncbi:hypothetical protein BTUL_0011g00870 [Botrytis tulipae]|uniref:Uncharacterized protein n=1 Tax=Botrytis tulipae TaxID=87230 RepID=A0A4Z1FA19_9HELO|nr:hypothetical protein BTUL_0011g00870 [Botrytis tulipae]
MAPNNIKIIRAIVAVTLLSISLWTAIIMDLEKIVAQQQPFIESGVIEWTSGIAVAVSSSITKDRISGAGSFASLKSLLVILGAISTAVWLFKITSSPFPIATVFLPRAEVQSDFVFHTRKALQADEVGTFMAAFLWLIFSFCDLHIAGLLDGRWLLYSTMLPVATVFAGPGTTLLIGWYLKEITLTAN